MKKNPVISVVVPMYKVEKFVPRCLESIQKQTFTDFEVLMINDGSPDKSAEIAKAFAEKDERFLLFNKSNGGLSDSRNYGIERARGEYIVFIDSDDYIHKDYLNVLYHECVDNNAEISYCRFKNSYFMSNICIPMICSAKKKVLNSQDALNLIIRDQYLQSYAWNKMYKKSLFTENNISYPNMFFEDIATSPILFFNATKIAVTNRYLYYYEKRRGSIISTMNMKKINDLLLSILIVRNYIQYNDVYEKYRDSINALAKKMYLVSMYTIVQQHIIKLDFQKIRYNFNTSRKLYKYITSDNYKATKNIPKLPFEIIQPEHKNKKNT